MIRDDKLAICIRYLLFIATNTSIHHRQTALIDWLRFQASWGKLFLHLHIYLRLYSKLAGGFLKFITGFWGNTEWLEARARAILSNQDWLDWMLDVTSTSTAAATAS